MEANKKYKDSIIRALLNNPKSALKLYCDISGREYNEETPVEMKSIEVRFHPKLRNDISFIVDNSLVIFMEHQSTLNKNMPLRLLQYLLAFLAAYYKLGDALYADTLIKLPKPEFYMLYNGKSPCPPSMELRLSDAFENTHGTEPPSLELVVKIININQESLMPKLIQNKEISGYAKFVSKTEKQTAQGIPLKEALHNAATECITEGILPEFFEKHRNEVNSMFSLIWDEERAKEVARREGREEGREEGMANLLLTAIEENAPVSLIESMAKKAGISKKRLEELMSA